MATRPIYRVTEGYGIHPPIQANWIMLMHSDRINSEEKLVNMTFNICACEASMSAMQCAPGNCPSNAMDIATAQVLQFPFSSPSHHTEIKRHASVRKALRDGHVIVRRRSGIWNTFLFLIPVEGYNNSTEKLGDHLSRTLGQLRAFAAAMQIGSSKLLRTEL